MGQRQSGSCRNIGEAEPSEPCPQRREPANTHTEFVSQQGRVGVTFKQPAGQGPAHLLGPDMTEHPSPNPAVSNLVSVLCHILNFGASLISLCREIQKRPQARKWWGFVLFFSNMHTH